MDIKVHGDKPTTVLSLQFVFVCLGALSIYSYIESEASWRKFPSLLGGVGLGANK
ncbi:MAG: hypothetical protein QXN24_04925 [Candidatus Bathyarchaeia archaeon]